MAIIRNMVRCKACDDVIESYDRHDFKYCWCGNVFVDGGKDYLRRGWKNGLGYEELSTSTEEEDDVRS